MRSKEEFDEFYNQELKKLLEQLEAKRLVVADKHSFKRYKRNLKWLGIICVAAIVAKLAASDAVPQEIFFCIPITILYAIIAPIVIAIRRSNAFDPVDREYKQIVIPKILGFISSNLQYKPSEGILKDEFVDGELFDLPSIFKSEDLVLGNVDGLEVHLSDIQCSRAARTKNKSSSDQQTVFEGFYAVIKMPRQFASRLLLQHENVITSAVGDFARSLIGDALVDQLNEKIDFVDLKTGNSEFDKAFIIRGQDQQAVQQVLTPTLIQLIQAFSKEINAPVSLAFFADQMHVAIRGINLFETDPYKSIVESDVSRQYFNAINLTVGIAKAVVQVGG